MHHFAKAKAIRKARESVAWALREASVYPSAHDRLLMATNPRKRVVKFTRFYGGRVREMDHGGIVSACKPLLDALKLIVGHAKQFGRMVEIHGAGIIFDDSMKWVTTLYDHAKSRVKAGIVEIEITEAV